MNHSSALPRQFALDLNQTPPASLHNFLVSGNEELKNTLERSIAAWPSASEREVLIEERWLYWWGNNGCGRTHLLKAMSYAAKERAIAFIELNPNQPNAWIECEDQLSRSYSKEVIVMTVDDVDQLDDRLQASLFRILNLVHANSNYFVYLAGSMAPNGLELREDLRTRLAWGLIFQIHPLTDSEKVSALTHAAKERA